MREGPLISDKCVKVARTVKIDENIYELRPTTIGKVGKLQRALMAKAKNEPGFRFNSLWDKVWREDILQEAYRRCRRNGGACGVDGEDFTQIGEHGLDEWLGKLREELRSGNYEPKALRRVWIPKSNGEQRPLGIPTVRDRVVQMAMVLVLSPIFEADFCDEQMGFRPGRDAKTAVRLVYYQIAQKGRQEVVDADLSDYFNTIPHGQLVRCLHRRVADGRVLETVRAWLKAPVEENRRGRANPRTTPAKDMSRGTPQGGVISPLLANIYFRRFILAWKKFGLEQQTNSVIVNYADDFVICCQRGKGGKARDAMAQIMDKIGLTINEAKTRLANVPEENFIFLGYELGRFYGKGGRPFIGTKPSRKSIHKIKQSIHDETTPRWYASDPEVKVALINQKLRGWANYFDQGPVAEVYLRIQNYTEVRLRRWLMRRSKQRGTGYRQYTDEYLYDQLGLFKLPRSRMEQSKAKAINRR